MLWQIDVEKAKALSKLLPPVPLQDIDVNVLESPNWLSHVKLLRKGLKSDVPPTPAKFTSSDGKDKEKKKKKKKPKLPPNYEIDRQPDPERWLPKYERSGYRPKKTRKGRVDVGKGTQGADSATSAI
jgi:signal recognition particle subunit SRP72